MSPHTLQSKFSFSQFLTSTKAKRRKFQTPNRIKENAKVQLMAIPQNILKMPHCSRRAIYFVNIKWVVPLRTDHAYEVFSYCTILCLVLFSMFSNCNLRVPACYSQITFTLDLIISDWSFFGELFVINPLNL